MTPQEAFEILGINPSEEYNLKKARNQASMKYHPDKGGSVEMQQKVNAAYELLKGSSVGSMKTPQDRKREAEERKAKFTKIAETVLSIIKKSIDLNKFKKYLEDQSGKSLNAEYSEQANLDSYWSNSQQIVLKFSSDDLRTVFYFRMSIPLDKVELGKSLGGGGGKASFEAYVDKFVLHNNKENKLGKTTWTWGASSSQIEDPKVAFPKSKLNKIFKGTATARKFSKRDMLRSLQQEFKARLVGDGAYIPIDDIYTLRLVRSVMMRVAAWGIYNVYQKQNKEARSIGTRFGEVTYASFLETEETLDWLRELLKELKKLKPDQYSDFINGWYKKKKDKILGEGFAMSKAKSIIEMMSEKKL